MRLKLSPLTYAGALTGIVTGALIGVAGCRSAGQPATVFATCPHRVRAVFDVGSGTTKLNVSEVTVCANGVVELVRTLDASQSTSVALEAAKTADGAISDEGVAQLVRAVTTLKQRAVEVARSRGFTAVDFAAAGTHAIRTCRNPEIVEAALARLGVPLVRLTQGEEAAMGLAGARDALAGCGTRAPVVWDVGGGSMQFTARDGSFRGLGLGAEGFKARVIQALRLGGRPACEAQGASANPLGQANVPAALALAEGLGRDGAIAADLGRACVVGVGGLHVRAVHAQVRRHFDLIKACACAGQAACAPSPDRYRRREVECLAEALANTTDCDPAVRGPYSGLAETNLILVAGFMRALNVDEVRVIDVNLSQGLALDRDRLSFRSEAIP